jgi:hypothetical protein
VTRRTRRQWAELDENTPARATVMSTVSREEGELCGIDGDGLAHVRFPADSAGVVDRVDPATLVAEVTR